jgi:hypothetical protein
MAEQSHRDEMNAAIRAQRERQAAPRTIAPIADVAPVPEPAAPQAPEEAVPQAPEEAVPQAPEEAAPQAPDGPPPRKSMFDRLRGR